MLGISPRASDRYRIRRASNHLIYGPRSLDVEASCPLLTARYRWRFILITTKNNQAESSIGIAHAQATVESAMNMQSYSFRTHKNNDTKPFDLSFRFPLSSGLRLDFVLTRVLSRLHLISIVVVVALLNHVYHQELVIFFRIIIFTSICIRRNGHMRRFGGFP